MKEFLNNILRADRMKHFFVGFCIAFLSLAFLAVTGLPLWVSIIITAIIGGGKEFYDKKTGRGTYEVFDFIYTVIPAILLYAVTLID